MGNALFTSGRWIVDAHCVASLIDSIQTIGGADAGPNRVLAALRHFQRDVRVGQVRASHADHVELALGDGMARRRHVADAGGVKNRELCRMAYLAGEIQVRG
jgi:hypothetical protein